MGGRYENRGDEERGREEKLGPSSQLAVRRLLLVMLDDGTLCCVQEVQETSAIRHRSTLGDWIPDWTTTLNRFLDWDWALWSLATYCTYGISVFLGRDKTISLAYDELSLEV